MSTEDEILENQKGVGELAAGGMDVASIAKAAGG